MRVCNNTVLQYLGECKHIFLRCVKYGTVQAEAFGQHLSFHLYKSFSTLTYNNGIKVTNFNFTWAGLHQYKEICVWDRRPISLHFIKSADPFTADRFIYCLSWGLSAFSLFGGSSLNEVQLIQTGIGFTLSKIRHLFHHEKLLQMFLFRIVIPIV